MGEQAHEKGTSVVGGRWRKGAAVLTKFTPRKKFAQGSARGQCPVVLYEADRGRRVQQEGAAGGGEEEEKQLGGTQTGIPEKRSFSRGNQNKGCGGKNLIN